MKSRRSLVSLNGFGGASGSRFAPSPPHLRSLCWFTCTSKGPKRYPGCAQRPGRLCLAGAERHQPATREPLRVGAFLYSDHGCRCAVAHTLVIPRSSRLCHDRRRQLRLLVDLSIYRNAPRSTTARGCAVAHLPDALHTPAILD